MDTVGFRTGSTLSPEIEADEQRLRADEADARDPHGAERRHERTLRALADVDAGRLIDDEAMQAWADSLRYGVRASDSPTRLMRVRWTAEAGLDLSRLHAFRAPVNRAAAANVVRSLRAAPSMLRRHPRIGPRLERYDPREVRRLIVGDNELRYEIADQTIFVLNLWHTREDR